MRPRMSTREASSHAHGATDSTGSRSTSEAVTVPDMSLPAGTASLPNTVSDASPTLPRTQASPVTSADTLPVSGPPLYRPPPTDRPRPSEMPSTPPALNPPPTFSVSLAATPPFVATEPPCPPGTYLPMELRNASVVSAALNASLSHEHSANRKARSARWPLHTFSPVTVSPTSKSGPVDAQKAAWSSGVSASPVGPPSDEATGPASLCGVLMKATGSLTVHAEPTASQPSRTKPPGERFHRDAKARVIDLKSPSVGSEPPPHGANRDGARGRPPALAPRRPCRPGPAGPPRHRGSPLPPGHPRASPAEPPGTAAAHPVHPPGAPAAASPRPRVPHTRTCPSGRSG